MPKRPKWEKPVPKWQQRMLPAIYDDNYRATKWENGQRFELVRGVWQPTTDITQSAPPISERSWPGNLPNDEYRFWLGKPAQHASTAICRACGAERFTAVGRRDHLKEVGCTKVLVAAYKELLADGVCVICDTKTARRGWGVPLCSIKCNNFWKFNQQQVLPTVKWAIDKSNRVGGERCECGHSEREHGESGNKVCLLACPCIKFHPSNPKTPKGFVEGFVVLRNVIHHSGSQII